MDTRSTIVWSMEREPLTATRPEGAQTKQRFALPLWGLKKTIGDTYLKGGFFFFGLAGIKNHLGLPRWLVLFFWGGGGALWPFALLSLLPRFVSSLNDDEY